MAFAAPAKGPGPSDWLRQFRANGIIQDRLCMTLTSAGAAPWRGHFKPPTAMAYEARQPKVDITHRITLPRSPADKGVRRGRPDGPLAAQCVHD